MTIRDLDLLVFLDALLSERNVSKAAQRVGISQPAMSNALGRLRKQLNDPLLVRTSKGMEPTERALDLMEPLHVAIKGLLEAVSPRVPFIPAQSRRSYTIACTDYLEQLVLPAVLQRINDEAPEVMINSVRVMDSSLELLEHGEIDAVIHKFDEPISDGFYQKQLFIDDFVCVVRNSHPCLKQLQNKKLPLAVYLQYGHIMITKTGIGKGVADKTLLEQGKKRRIAINVRQSSTSPVLLALDSDLIATVPRLTAQKFAQHLPITLLEVPLDLPAFDLSMVWSPLSHHSQSHLWFRRIIMEVCEPFNSKV